MHFQRPAFFNFPNLLDTDIGFGTCLGSTIGQKDPGVPRGPPIPKLLFTASAWQRIYNGMKGWEDLATAGKVASCTILVPVRMVFVGVA